ncbi:hypothetical protein ABFS83_02G113300 [Erythranthe nasuta]
MGQAQSSEAVEDQTSQAATTPPPTETSSEKPSLDSLIAEAAAYGEDDTTELSPEAKAQKALDCPCIAHLRSGPCGAQFSEAFVCFLKSSADEKGSDCVSPFVALQNCIKTNPDAFSSDVLDEDEVEKVEEEKPKSDTQYKIRPPLWSNESKSANK